MYDKGIRLKTNQNKQKKNKKQANKQTNKQKPFTNGTQIKDKIISKFVRFKLW